MASSGKVTLFFLSFRYYRCLLSFLPTTWATFVVFVMLGHLELCWFWLDYTFVVVDTSFVLFGMVKIQLISILFSLCGICSIDFFYSTSSPFYSFKPMGWNMKRGFCWFILFPPLVLCFFLLFPLFSVLIPINSILDFQNLLSILELKTKACVKGDIHFP